MATVTLERPPDKRLPALFRVSVWRALWRGRERATILFAAAAALLLVSLALPYWTLRLYAPQYPQGLAVDVYLTHAGGDVEEVDNLNHYIGMARLTSAAPVERWISVYGVALATLALLIVRYSGRRVPLLLAAPAILLPVVFAADLFFWLARYGWHLSAAAPIHIDPFTPPLLGRGLIAQFRTTSVFGPGFYLAVAAAGFAVAGAVVRVRVCQACPLAAQCAFVCLSPNDSSR
jgi:copper chaperone NosL